MVISIPIMKKVRQAIETLGYEELVNIQKDILNSGRRDTVEIISAILHYQYQVLLIGDMKKCLFKMTIFIHLEQVRRFQNTILLVDFFGKLNHFILKVFV